MHSDFYLNSLDSGIEECAIQWEGYLPHLSSMRNIIRYNARWNRVELLTQMWPSV